MSAPVPRRRRSVRRWTPATAGRFSFDPLRLLFRSLSRVPLRVRSLIGFRAALVAGCASACLALAAARLGAQTTGGPPGNPTRTSAEPRDTAGPSDTTLVIRVGGRWADSLRLPRLAILGPFGSAAGVGRSPAIVADSLVRLARARRAFRLERGWATIVREALTAPAIVVTASADAPSPAAVDTAPRPGSLIPVAAPRGADAGNRNALASDILGDFGDLGITLRATLESKLQRTRNEICNTSQITNIGTNCFATFQPSFDFQFNTRIGGVVAERVFMNVDYDSQREFDASNNISIRYEGKTDEILQRLEVGNVSAPIPASRFITSGIPSGNYGIQATGQIGPMRFTSIAAQQKGNVKRDNVYTVGERVQQSVDRQIQDTDLATRRFFFTIDPRQLGGYPNIDLLNRQQMQQLASALPDSVRPVRVYVYRQLIGASNQNPRGPRFSVRGARNPTRQIYELLRENVDYYLDPSQLWIALKNPLQQNGERLAVAYEVNTGGIPGRNVNTGGTPDIEFTEAPQFANLLWEPELQPDNPAYFLREIKSAYQLGGDDVQRATVSVKLVTGTSGDQEKPLDPSRGETYLQMFGLSQATNPSRFDVENRLWPRPNDPNFIAGSGGTQKLIPYYFILYPSVQPFARAGLAQPLANPANDTIYRYPNEYLYSQQRPQAIYRMIATYQSEGGGSEAAIQLRSVQLRPNSERVSLDGRLLMRDSDYVIDYETGRIAFNRPDTLFPSPRPVTVSYEENPLGISAPTSILGFISQFPMEHGELSFTAISQNQRTGLTRPPLGFEPVGSMVAGVTGSFAWDADLLSRAVARLTPYGNRLTPSRVALQTEFALSKPQPNSAGQAYIESYESDNGVGISMSDAAWYYGARPALGQSLSGLGSVLQLSRATSLAYQSNGFDGGGRLVQYRLDQIDPAVRFANGGVQGTEPVLFMTLYPLNTGGLYNFGSSTSPSSFGWRIGPSTSLGPTPTGRRWRSLRTVINPSGADLSRTETIEFFVQVRTQPEQLSRNPTLVLDLGELSENSVTFAPETLLVRPPAVTGGRPDSTYRGKRVVGFDRFDSERDPFSRTFNAQTNDRGLAGDVADTLVVVDSTGAAPVVRVENGVRLCNGTNRSIQTLGDTRGNCTVANNRLDEEDIDLDGQLNIPSSAAESEQVRRFIVDLSRSSTWTRVGGCSASQDSTGAAIDSLCWVQVRLNWRSPSEDLNSPNVRRIRAMRVTMISSASTPDDDFVRIGLSRFRLVSAPWLKRTDRPISGIAGDSVTLANGYVIASVVGTLDSSSVLPYTPPPGVAERPENQQDENNNGYRAGQIQVNERALRVQTGVDGGPFRPFDRGEAYVRFQEGTKTFMGYRTLRVWMRGRGNGWGPNGELNGFIKIGRDESNFYLYRTPVNEGPAQNAWDPEIRVDLTRFQALRAQLESNYLQGGSDSLACSGTDLELIRRSGLPRGSVVRRYAVCADGYMVYSADPTVTPPNLAGVQELAVGIVRVDSIPRGGRGIMQGDTLELWIDDIRLGDVVDDIGFAGEVTMAMNAGDLADVRLSLSRRDPNFRQLGETPTFLTSSGVAVGTTLHLERFLPARFGVVIPFNIDYGGTGVEQLFINRTDVRADGIVGLRNPSDSRVNYSFAVRRAEPLARGWYRYLVNGFTVNGAWGRAASQSAFQEARASNYTLNGSLDLSSDVRESRLPRPIDWVLGLLPTSLRESGAIRNIRGGQYRWVPSQFRITSGLARVANNTTSYTKAAASVTDTGQTVYGLTHVWQNAATLRFAPTTALVASFDARQLLDLRDYRDRRDVVSIVDSVDRAAAANAERLRVLGADIGLERDRSFVSAINFAPVLATWLRPSVDFSSTFTLVKDPNARALLRDDDSTGAFRLPKRLGASQTFNAATQFDLGRLVRSHTGEKTLAYRMAGFFGASNVRYTRGLTSNYDNTVFDPGLAYQLGLGSVTSFRGLDSRLATAAGRIERLSATGILNLPLAMQLTARVDDGGSETWTRRVLDGYQALITSDQNILPDLDLRWSFRPRRLARIASQLSFSTGYTVTSNRTVVPNERGGLADRSFTRTEAQSGRTAITWAFLGALQTDITVRTEHRDDERPGSLTQGDTRQLSASLVRNFSLPKRWKSRSKLNTRFSYSAEETKAVVSGRNDEDDPSSAVDPFAGASAILTNNGRRSYNLNGSTQVSETLTFTMSGSQVVTFDRSYNRRLSNLVFSAALAMSFFGGSVR